MSFTVTITGVVAAVEVYGGSLAAVDYIGAMLGASADAWRALSADNKARSLVVATRYLDTAPWQGTATLSGTTLQWPRSGVLNADGTAVDSATVPAAIVNATFELAALVADDPDIVASFDTGSNVQAVNAGGGVGVVFFNPTSSRTGTASKMPVVVQRLVGRYLDAAVAGIDGAFGQAGNTTSQFDSCHTERRVWPY